ncbi:MAG: DNA-binding response regulator [Oscillatoriales cyanobacterium]|nr:MAG: DNA-binding response regulator [Oscillatoriales cyanobacterium]
MSLHFSQRRSSAGGVIPDDLGAIEDLTHREQEILNLIAQGQSNQDIAQTLHIAPGTVRVHIHAILQKLGVRDRTQAVVHLLQRSPLGSSRRYPPTSPQSD